MRGEGLCSWLIGLEGREQASCTLVEEGSVHYRVGGEEGRNLLEMWCSLPSKERCSELEGCSLEFKQEDGVG